MTLSPMPEAVRMGRALYVEMRSPDGPIWSGEAKYVAVPGSKGAFGVLPRHAPLMSSLELGLTRIRPADGVPDMKFVTGGGFVEIFQNHVLLLVDFADPTESIDVARATEAKKRAEARLRSHDETVDVARAEAALQRALMRLRYAGAPRI
ncbi:MAG: ATP synthase F1 subunit epsilon [Planctomycetes bacterium]|nr:ATP synthase F1 subunit epsilon [Planctomycetota bacterium]